MRLLLVLALSAVVACGGDDAPPDDDDILDHLRAQPEIVRVTERPTQLEGYRYFELWFRQPIDHADPGAGTFEQQATLIHRDPTAPLVVLHTGYGNWYGDFPDELTELLHANQIAIEHRFFRGSRPTGLEAWAHLTIEQAANDHHVVATALHRLYTGAFVETGASKGGMTSIYHRRFFPEDVDATVAYVAPISFAAPDYRYDGFFDGIGPAACRDALHAVQRELLMNRRPALVDRAAGQAAELQDVYTRIELEVAVESAISGLEWAFWQYEGVSACGGVPAPTASLDQMWAFLEAVNPVRGSRDAYVAEFEAYYYQATGELGFPGTKDVHLDGLLTAPPDAYDGAYPLGVTLPAYDPAAMQDVDAWVKASGERLLFIYGEYDPWTGGMFDLGGATDSLRVVAPQGSHSSGIVSLTPADQTAALAKLEAWTGVTPDVGVWSDSARRAAPRMPRVPPIFLRGR